VKNVYLASRYSRADEMRGVRDVLTALGLNVTAHWIDHHGGKYPGSFTPEQLNDDPDYCAKIAAVDWADLNEADTVISFTGNGGKGGRHVEFGMAVALGKRLIVVGPREHVFHTLPAVEHYHDWPHLVMAVQRELSSIPA
jgi:hypothetical protein